jgi:hypothetical protein
LLSTFIIYDLKSEGSRLITPRYFLRLKSPTLFILGFFKVVKYQATIPYSHIPSPSPMILGKMSMDVSKLPELGSKVRIKVLKLRVSHSPT